MLTLLRRPLRLVLGMLPLAGCGSEPPPVVSEPGNVVVVENPALSPGSILNWMIGAAPALSIGLRTGNDAYLLVGVRDAVVLPDGRVAIANRGTGEIRVFHADGTHAVSMGGAGRGPGEFGALEVIERWVGDSIMGWDVRQQRVSIFDAQGNHGRTFRVARFNDSFRPELLGVTREWRLLLRAGFPQRNDEPYHGMFRPDQMYALVDGEGELAVDLGAHPGEEGLLSAGGGFEVLSEHPHGKSTEAVVWGDHVLIASNDTYELRVFDLNGHLSKVIRLDHEALQPTRKDMEAWFEEFTANDTPEERADFRRTFEDLPLLETFPAFSGVVVDGLDHLWVRDFSMPGDDRTTWIVFDPEGHVLGRIETPRGLEVYEIGPDYILGRARDELNVESIQRWSLTR